jgi:hypothetical protein
VRTHLLHPLPLAAAAALLINDHLLKAAEWPHPLVTGKLSDVAGLFVFPILLTAITRRWPALWCLATGIGFALVKLSPAFNHAVEVMWGRNSMDPSDLLALPVLVGSWRFLRRDGETAPAVRRAVASGFIAIACAATPAPRWERDYPWWELTGAEKELGCAHATAWVSKAGKTGFGLSVRLSADGAGCTLDISAASIRLADGTEAPGLPPRSIALEPCQTTIAYVPFRFDSEAAWNLGVRSGVITLSVGSLTWTMPAEHRLVAYQRERVPVQPPLEPPPRDCAPVKAIAK